MNLQQVALFLLLALVIAGVFAPFESLSWWARSGPADAREVLERAQQSFAAKPDWQVQEAEHYVVFLTGIGAAGVGELPQVETPVIERLRACLGGTALIDGIYPYSPENRGLTAQRPLAWMWRRVAGLKKRGRLLGFLINVRNSLQVFVSADRRYGPVYNLGVAEQIWTALRRHGYRPESSKPVTLVGWSGGAQIALGSAWYLASLGIPVYVLSVAGVFGSDPGLSRVTHLWHLYGQGDKLQRVGTIFSAGRWGIMRNSPWNIAKREGRVTLANIGRFTHGGPTGYFSTKPLGDGTTPAERTVEAIVGVLTRAGLAGSRRAD